MQAAEFFKDHDVDGEVIKQEDGTFLWFISYIGDANSGMSDEYECHDVTWDAYCEAAQIINKHGYKVTESYAEHDYVSATFIPDDERCKYCNGTGRWKGHP